MKASELDKIFKGTTTNPQNTVAKHKSTSTKTTTTQPETTSSRQSNVRKLDEIFRAPTKTTTTQPAATNRTTELTRLNSAADSAKKAYNDYLKSAENRQHQKTWGRESDKARELYDQYSAAKQTRDSYAKQNKIQNYVDIASNLNNKAGVKSEVDKERAKNLGADKTNQKRLFNPQTTEAQRQQKMGYSTWNTEKYQAMTADEAEIYNRLYKNGYKKEAEDFLNTLDSELNYRVTKTRTDKAQQTAQENALNGIAASAGSSLLNSLGTGLTAELEGIRAAVKGEEIDPYSEQMYGRNLSNALRGAVSESVGNWAATLPTSTAGTSLAEQSSGKFKAMSAEKQQESNRKIAEFLYNTGMSMADMVAMTPLNTISKAAGLPDKIQNLGMSLMMGTNAGADALIDAKTRGLSNGQAVTISVLSGAAEVLAEKYSLDSLFGGKVSTSSIKAALTQGGIEASEEMVTELANALTDVFVAGKQSNFEESIKEYEAQGMTYTQAQNKAVVDVLADIAVAGAGGFVSGSIMGGLMDYANTQTYGQSIIDETTVKFIEQGQTEAEARQNAINYLKEELRAVGALADEDTTAYKLSQKNGNMTTGDIGRAYMANETAIAEDKVNLEKQTLAELDSRIAEIDAQMTDASRDADIAESTRNAETAALDPSAYLYGDPDKIKALQDTRQQLIDERQRLATELEQQTNEAFDRLRREDETIAELQRRLETVEADSEEYKAISEQIEEAQTRRDEISLEATDIRNQQENSLIPQLEQQRNALQEQLETTNPNTEEYSKISEQIANLDTQIGQLSTEPNARQVKGLMSQLEKQPFNSSRKALELRQRINDLSKHTIAEIANDTERQPQQTKLSEKEYQFAQGLSEAVQKLKVINAETSALGGDYYAKSEELPSLHDIQNKSMDQYTSEDFAVLAKHLVGSGKQRLYLKETSRVLDTVAGGNKELRNVLYNAFEKPFNEAGGNYGRSLSSAVDSYKQIMQECDIKPKSREDAAAQRYGEGFFQAPDGTLVEYTLRDLQQEFPDTWENIKKFAETNRQIYENYLERINSMLETIYPNVLENAETEYEEAATRRDVAKAKTDAMVRAITEKKSRIQELQNTRNGKKQKDTKVFAKIEGSIASERAKLDSMKSELATLEKRQRIAEMNAQAKRAAIDSGAIYEGKRILPRKDYFHHAQEMLDNYSVLDFLKPKNINEDVTPAMAGISDQTKPKSKWWGAMRHRGQGAYFESASNSMASYIGMAEYKLAYDPLTNYMRSLETTLRNSAETVHAKNASGFIEWMKDWTDGISGKSDHIIDRGVQKAISRQTLNSLNNLNKRVRANKVMGNIRTMFVQSTALANSLNYITSPTAWKQGVQMLAEYRTDPNSDVAKIRRQSNFMAQRYGDSAMDIMESDNLTPKKIAGMGMDLLQHLSDDLTWFAAFSQFNDNPQAAMSGMKRTYENAIDYADDITRRSAAGRGVGEGALLLNSKTVNLISPFQTEVLNQWNTQLEKIKELKGNPEMRKRAAAGLAAYEVSAFAFNSLLELVLGDKVLGNDFIGALVDVIKNADEDDEDKNVLEYAKEFGQASLGTIVDAMPLVNFITAFIGEDASEALFGDYSPTRYGSGNIGIRAAADALMWGKDTAETVMGIVGGNAEFKDLDWEGGIDAVGNFVTPWGGTQIARSTKGLVDYARGGNYDSEGNLRYAVDQNALNLGISATLGRNAMPERKAWAAKGFPKYTAEQTKAYDEFKKAGGSIDSFTDFKAKYDELSETIGADNKEISELAKDIAAANPLLSDAEAKERAQNQLGKQFRNAENEYLSLVGNSDMTDEQKLAAMSAIGLSDDDIKKVKGLLDNGVSVSDYIKYQTLYSDRGSTDAEDKNALVSALMADKSLTANEKTMLANRIIDGDWITDFTSQAANDILTKYGKSTYNGYKEAKAEGGISAETYLNYASKKDKIVSDYDQYGSSISYSKKAKVVNYLESLNISEEQKEYMYHNVFGYSSSYKSRFNKMKLIDGVWHYEYDGKWIKPTY